MTCYRRGGCGPYEMRSCYECPASKPEYAKRAVEKNTTSIKPQTTRKYYNKLVRDRIPEIITANGGKCTYELLNKERFREALEAKLDEEVAEYHKNPCIEELADILTVLCYLASTDDKFNAEDVESLIKQLNKKAEERGAFEAKVFLKWVEEEDTDK